ncbi:Hypothetical predicted protein [Lecanosticta acicola]|uniref:Uncharacterized protein n=1 Tax=Lecanosticta acicola TaxID=111012 RepID=A0AAI9EEB4_9PEZI|nr:Hypothetical predicted protein [Lecanosticta acicola]
MTAPTPTRATRANYTPGIPMIDNYFQANPISDLTELDASHFCELFLLLSPIIFPSDDDQDAVDESEVSRRMKNFMAYLQRHCVVLKPKEGKKVGVKKLVAEAVGLWRVIVEDTDDEGEGAVAGAEDGNSQVQDVSHGVPVVQRKRTVQGIAQAKVHSVIQKKAMVHGNAQVKPIAQKKLVIKGNAQTKPSAQKKVITQGHAQDNVNTPSYSNDGPTFSDPNHIDSSNGEGDLTMSYISDRGECTANPPPLAIMDNNNTNDLNTMASSSSSTSAATDTLNNLLLEIMQEFQAGEYLRSVVLLGKASGFVVKVGEEAIEGEKQYYESCQQADQECFDHCQDQDKYQYQYETSDVQVLAGGDDSGDESHNGTVNREEEDQVNIKQEEEVESQEEEL